MAFVTNTKIKFPVSHLLILLSCICNYKSNSNNFGKKKWMSCLIKSKVQTSAAMVKYIL